MLQSIYTHAGCDYGCLYTYSPRHCFNPHTHAGCDITVLNSRPSNQVSIHTPTQGVTRYSINQFKIWMFQSTHPRRVWHWCFCFPLCGIFLFQSTHPRRVWLIISYKHAQSVSFNPHTHAGCDRSGRFTLCCSMDVSIHTPTQGVTTLAAVNSRNPRVSIHTPTQGVTIVYIGKLYHVPVSIHTPTQGVTQAEVWKVWHRSFNPHTHAGCDSISNNIL